MSSPVDYTSPMTQFAFDVNQSPFFKKDNQNVINIVSAEQLNTLQDTSILDVYLSVNNMIEPHYHQNASELTYCISGALTVAIMNPFTKEFTNYALTPGQVVNIPQGWWHFNIATANNTHFLGIFNAGTPEVILGSDILTSTPANIMAHTYCLDENQWKAAIATMQPSTLIGPTKECVEARLNQSRQYPPNAYRHPSQMYPPRHTN